MPTAVPTRDDLVESAAKLVPLLRSRALWIDENRRLPPDVIEAIEASGLLRMQAPAQYGGYESDARTFIDVLAEIARGNSSVAFVMSIYASLTWMVGLWPDETLDEVFADPHVRVTGTTAASGKATRVDGGYLLNGSWGFNSGVLHGHWKITAAMPEGPAGETFPVFCLVPVSELEIVDDWHTHGLQGSGSVTTLAKDVFVPDRRVISGADFYQNVSKSRVNAAKGGYRVPMLVTATAMQTGQLVGAAKYALSSFLERLPGRPLTYTDYPSQRDAPITHLQIGEAALLIEDAEARAHRFADLLAAKIERDEPWSQQDRVFSRVQIGWIAQQAKQAVEILAAAGGGSSIFRDVPITRIRRDVHATSLHSLITPATNIELYGRSLAGLEPNTVYL
ncbi:Acyl-CoA dehydrogenase [Streptomyces sp. DvalAA-14]|uniref:acyl-CoA dehydrogenase family protein n=1 Tax=unclassified Streptomyces TaxID=2593676 RepID=UPI00081B4DD8|nr:MULTISPECIES: acyl-CoA dehydrogenase family protein [unclassified Streptomyces]MYS19325.1 acyl-CoA dehydrogenase [Streptomyces sp. SID4948]SCD41895.1 Acyl-CoA dehydrogenase [Streptomyces sp. DvalAA-14]